MLLWIKLVNGHRYCATARKMALDCPVPISGLKLRAELVPPEDEALEAFMSRLSLAACDCSS